MTTEGYERKLTAILSGDFKGYSRLVGEDEVRSIRPLTSYRGAVANLIGERSGREIQAEAE